MSSIMIFIFIIYNIFNTTNNGEKLYVRAVIIRKETKRVCYKIFLSMNI